MSDDLIDSAAQRNSTLSTMRVVVTGDVTVDWNLARTRTFADAGAAWTSADRIETYPGPGGAALVSELMHAVGEAERTRNLTVEISGPSLASDTLVPNDPAHNHAFAIWSRHPRRAGDRDRPVWRVEEFLGLDRAQGGSDPDRDTALRVDPPTADLVIIDDADLGFRNSPQRWPRSLALAGPREVTPWVLLKMAAPIAEGELWRTLIAHRPDRLVVVMTLDDLRLSEVKISRELSWERIAGDLARELVRHPAVNGLARCAQVIVSLGTGGAVLLSRTDPADREADRTGQTDCHVFFDPESIENSWVENYPGSMIGYTTSLVAAIARELILGPNAPDVHRGIRRGLAAQRALHLVGYGDPQAPHGRASLAFPAATIAAQLQKEPAEFASAQVEQPMHDSWSILESRYPEGLEPVAEAVALDGVEAALSGVPLGRFGKLLTLDRGEIEGFRSIRALMREYDAEPAPRPLNIAVFGPPGAGKSFGVKAVAKSAIDGNRIEDLTFNMSQMTSAADIVDALHQVRDVGLRGKLPFVLWDEFDADLDGTPFGWLHHFLAPMQDGAFQQGQLLHPIGKAIFVFAGGTSSRLAEFAGNDSEQFRLAKGPDFVSRLKGHVDIVGPDPRGGDPDSDPHFRIRRAILLRSMLLRDRPGIVSGGRLQIDHGVLRAFLEIPAYRHGARSMETIVAMSTLHGASRYERSALPAADQLDAHVDARAFLELVERYVPDGDLLDRLARAVHATYCQDLLVEYADMPESMPEILEWDDLPEHLKQMNRAAARDVSDKLAVLGYVLCQDPPAPGDEVLIDPADPRVDQLARREHERWMRRKLKTGWRYGGVRDDNLRLHPALRPWLELPDEETHKDRAMILGLPKVVHAAGMGMTRIDDRGELVVGVTGHRVLAEADRVAAGIDAALARIAENHPGRPLTVVSELAEGSDRLAVRHALKYAGSRMIAVLPLPKYDYLDDFESEGSKNEFLELLDAADEIVELPSRANRAEAYAAAGDELLDRAQALLVVWDGSDAQGQGGTGEVVAHARERGLPIAWVHAGNRRPGTMEPISLGTGQGTVTYEKL